MKALSVKHPWAWALVSHLDGSPIGDKRVENRSWKTDYRGDLLIVSSARQADDVSAAMAWIEEHAGVRPSLGDPYRALGRILGVVKMVDCLDIVTYERRYGGPNPWATGPYCFCFENVRRLPPTQAQGRLGLYNIDTVHGVPVDEWVKQEAVRVGQR